MPYVYGLPRWLSGKESSCNVGDTGDANLIPGLGRSPGEGSGNPLQYSCQKTEEPGRLQFIGWQRVGHERLSMHVYGTKLCLKNLVITENAIRRFLCKHHNG